MTNSTNHTKVLVTGGTGFVGVHCILQLLQQGYQVRTTLRTMSRQNEVKEMLREGGIQSFDSLEFIEADLSKDANWEIAAAGCDYVLHVASPLSLATPKHENELIVPAVEGTLRVLKASRDAGVKRVVVTSSFAAVGYSHTDPTQLITEKSWTNPNDKTISTYVKSKTLAEKAAWNFMETEGGNLELAVVNPVAIFGPSLGTDMSGTFEILRPLIEGKTKRLPRLHFGIVDVRDVADLHLKAMLNPKGKGERFLAVSGGVMSFKAIALLLKNELGDKGTRISTRTVPDWVLRIAALFNPTAKSIVPMLGRLRNASNAKAKTLLGWEPRTNEEAIMATAESLFKFGLIKNAGQ